MSSSFTPRLKPNSTVRSSICARRDCTGSTAPSANVSRILTPPRLGTDSEQGGEPCRCAARGVKGRITGIASHLNHVPDTTCHIGRGDGGSGTAIAITTSRSGRYGPEGEEQNARVLKRKHGFGSSRTQNRTPGPRIRKIRRSSTHKQATERPGLKTRGDFFVAGFIERS